MAKKLLVETLLERARQDLAVAEKAAAESAAGARDESMKSDGKYDTRGIEAGYLAGAQLKRVEELKLEVQMLEEIPLKDYGPEDEAGLGALVDIELNGQVRTYFLCSTAGGTLLQHEGRAVLVISVFSPIGDAVMGCKSGEEFELETQSGPRLYRVLKIL